MPTYEYRCPHCGECTEARAAYGDNTGRPCPSCGSHAVRQSVYLITPFTESGVQVGRLSPTPRDEKRINLSKFQEASAEVAHQYEKAGKEPPDLYHQGLRRADMVLAGKIPPPKEF